MKSENYRFYINDNMSIGSFSKDTIDIYKKIQHEHQLPELTDMSGRFKQKRLDAIKKYAKDIENKSILKEYIICNIVSTNYAALDEDCNVMTAATLYYLDSLFVSDVDLSLVSKWIPKSRDVLDAFEIANISDTLFDKDLIKSVECVFRFRNGEVTNSQIDENGLYRSLITDMPKTINSSSFARTAFDELMKLIPQEHVDYALEQFDNFATYYKKELFAFLEKNATRFESLLKDAKNAKDRLSAGVNTAGADIGVYPKQQRNLAVLNKKYTDIESMSEDKKKLLLGKTNLLMSLSRDKEIAVGKVYLFIISLLKGWSSPVMFDVYDGSFEFDPYAICFALLYLTEKNDDRLWLYGIYVNMMYAVAQYLPWNVGLPRSEKFANYMRNLFNNTDIELSNKIDWYDRKYSCKKFPDEKISLSGLVYFLTGMVMPRHDYHFDQATKLMKELGIRGNTNRELIALIMLVLNNFRNLQTIDIQDKLTFSIGKDFQFKEISSTPEVDNETFKLYLDDSDNSDNSVEKLEADLNKANKSFNDLNNELKETKQQLKVTNSKLYQTEKQVEEQQSTIEELENKLKERTEEFDRLFNLIQNFNSSDESVNDEDDTKEYIYPFVAEKKVLIFGGHDSFGKALKQLVVGNVKFITQNSKIDDTMIKNSDSIWIQWNAITHSMYNKIMDVARKYNKIVMYFERPSAKKSVNQIIDFYSRGD